MYGNVQYFEEMKKHGESIVTNHVVLSGSFNPIHKGHQLLLEAASKKCGVSDTCFEMSLKNADKG